MPKRILGALRKKGLVEWINSLQTDYKAVFVTFLMCLSMSTHSLCIIRLLLPVVKYLSYVYVTYIHFHVDSTVSAYQKQWPSSIPYWVSSVLGTLRSPVKVLKFKICIVKSFIWKIFSKVWFKITAKEAGHRENKQTNKKKTTKSVLYSVVKEQENKSK